MWFVVTQSSYLHFYFFVRRQFKSFKYFYLKFSYAFIKFTYKSYHSFYIIKLLEFNYNNLKQNMFLTSLRYAF